MQLVPENMGICGGRLLVFESLSSTNRWAASNIDDLGHGDVVCAVRQTAGRGRFARSWLTPGGRGLALSVVFRQFTRAEMKQDTGRMAAVAVRGCIEACGIDGGLKWPNDVLANGRKIAGILAEQVGEAVVLGIGLNVNVTQSDLAGGELVGTATSMLIETGNIHNMAAVRGALLFQLERTVDLAAGDPRYLASVWLQHDALAGCAIEVDGPGGAVAGKYRGVDDRGRLLLAGPNGEKHAFWSGDVRRVAECG